jgi:hypothetical protein
MITFKSLDTVLAKRPPASRDKIIAAGDKLAIKRDAAAKGAGISKKPTARD